MFLVYEKLPCRPRRDTRGMQVPSSGTDEEEDRGTGVHSAQRFEPPMLIG